MEENKQLKEDLNHFTGTEKYYASSFGGLKLTDGIHYLRETANCYWFIDIIESYQHKLKDIHFQLWKIVVNDDRTAVVTCIEDIDQPNLVKQELQYTDFPLKEFECYCIDGVVLLKSEY